MTNTNNPISTEEAQVALTSLESANKKTIKSVRPPIWLNFIISFFIGMVAFAAPLSSGNSLWSFILLVSAAAMFIGIFFLYFMLRQSGIKQNMLPTGFKNNFFNIAQGLFVAFLMLGSIDLYKAGFLWMPYLSGPLVAIIMSYILHNFPTGELK